MRYGAAGERLAGGELDPRHDQRIELREQLDPPVALVDHHRLAADRRLAARPATVGGRLVLIEILAGAVAEAAHVTDEAAAGRVQVQVSDLGVAGVAEPVHDQRRDPCQGAGGDRDLLVLGPEPDREHAVEHVEEVGVQVVDVGAGAVAAGGEPRPGRMQLVGVGEHHHPAVGRVADDLAPAREDHRRLAHRAECMNQLAAMRRRTATRTLTGAGTVKVRLGPHLPRARP